MQESPKSDSGLSPKLAILLPPLVLLVPFIGFLKHSEYNLVAPEVLLLAAGWITIGALLGLVAKRSRLAYVMLVAVLLTGFVDFQFDYLKAKGLREAMIFLPALALCWMLRGIILELLCTIFGALLVSGLLLGEGTVTAPYPVDVEQPGAAEPDRNLPLYLHLVLDGHIGTEGIPRELEGALAVRQQLQAFFRGNGFALYGGAYSEYSRTKWALGHLLNASSGEYRKEFLAATSRRNEWILVRNDHFERRAQEGYRVHVSQSNYLNFCRSAGVPMVACMTFPFASTIKLIDESELPVREKARLLLGAYLQRSTSYKRLRRTFISGRFAPAGPEEERIWTWDEDVPHYTRVEHATLQQIDRLVADLRTAQRGDFYFVHLLFPHAPYRYTADCSPRHRSELGSTGTIGGWKIRNTAETRRTRYALYHGQVQCTLLQLEKVFAALRENGLYDDAVIVIHGDHGSRISLLTPHVQTKGAMTLADYTDTFSTLFAVKSPSLEARYDATLLSAQALFAAHAQPVSEPGREADMESSPSDPPVFLMNDDEHVDRATMPDFTAPSADPDGVPGQDRSNTAR
jgi:hypothetical protein